MRKRLYKASPQRRNQPKTQRHKGFFFAPLSICVGLYTRPSSEQDGTSNYFSFETLSFTNKKKGNTFDSIATVNSLLNVAFIYTSFRGQYQPPFEIMSGRNYAQS